MAINNCSFVSYCSLFICVDFLVRQNRNLCGSKGMSGSQSPGDLHPQNSCSVHWSLTLCNPKVPGTDHTDRNTSIICLERAMHPVIWRMWLSPQNIRPYSSSLSISFFCLLSCYISLLNSFIALCYHIALFYLPLVFFVCFHILSLLLTYPHHCIRPSSPHEARCMLGIIYMYVRGASGLSKEWLWSKTF